MIGGGLAGLSRTDLVLEGEHVRLEPLTLEHGPDLFAVAQDGAIWRWLTAPTPSSLADMHAYIAGRLKAQADGDGLAFAVIDRSSGRAVGATRYHNVSPQHRQLEIGGTWYGTAYQRTAVNTESKYLLLRHAFETLDCVRVVFTTDAENERSRRAIERLGAIREGILRNYRIGKDGSTHLWMMYSIVGEQWPTVKARLETFLAPRIAGEQARARSSGKMTYRWTRKLPVDQLARLWHSVGWWTNDNRPMTRLPAALAHSHSVITAWDGGRLVGLANAVSDGHLVVYYPYILVEPPYQRQGVGAKLLALMQERYVGMRQQILISTKEAVPFYERHGFSPSELPGMHILNLDA